MRFSLIIIFLVILFASCSTQEQKDQLVKKEKQTGVPASNEAVVRTMNRQEAPKDNFQYDPIKVVEAVFEAARTKDYSVLSTLCDPLGENDDPTSHMCDVGNATKEREEDFIEYFSTGSVVGEVKIEGNTASVPIKFGPNGELDEVFVLVLRNGMWYLGQI
ncbi:MAG: hypothetical protein HRT57_08545 [Crocinitomicaceae bacterium]|nr:hypothetical protein [Crocinitomicaceae bacterium]